MNEISRAGRVEWTPALVSELLDLTKEQIDETDGSTFHYSYVQIAGIMSDRHRLRFTKDSVQSVMKRVRRGTINSTEQEAVQPEPSKSGYRELLIPAQPQSRTLITGYTDDSLDFSTEALTDPFGFPAPEDPGFEHPPLLEFDSMLFICDVHAPYQSKEMLGTAVRIAKMMGVRNILLGGDLTTQDSVDMKHPKNMPIVSLDKELKIAGRVIMKLSEHFERMFITNGNHDERVAKALNTDFRLAGLIQYALATQVPHCDLHVTEFDYYNLLLSGVPWQLGHYSRFKRAPGSVGREIAEQMRANVAGGHEHGSGFQSTSDGKFIGISVGGMMDIDKEGRSRFAYNERRMKSYPPMKNGFLIIKNGTPYLFDGQGSTALNGVRPWEWWYENASRVV